MHVSVHANWVILFILHCEFDTEHLDASEAIVQKIYTHDMQCDQITPVFPIPSVLLDGISLH